MNFYLMVGHRRRDIIILESIEIDNNLCSAWWGINIFVHFPEREWLYILNVYIF